MAKVKVINPRGVEIECEDTDNGYLKAQKGEGGWSLPEPPKVDKRTKKKVEK